MAEKKHGVIIETPMEARQAEPGPSILLLLEREYRGDRLGHRLVRVLAQLILHDVRFRLVVMEIAVVECSFT